MPANVETAVYANEPAWHREGLVLDTDGQKGLTIEKALPASGLDWEVAKVPIFGYAPDDFTNKGQPKRDATPVHISGRYGVQRNTDNKILGVVGKSWTPVQNRAGFDIINDVIEQAGGKVWIEAGGSLDGGRKVWILAHVDNDLQIAGEDYASYIAFINGHDGRTSVTALMTDVRIVCQNTLDLAVGQADKKNPGGKKASYVETEGSADTRGAGKIVRVRHTTKAAERIQEAHAILGLRNQRAEELARQGEWLVEQPFTDGEFDKFLEDLLPIKEEDTPAATMIQERRETITGLFQGAENLEPIRNTKWGALQSVLEYSDHGRKFQNDTTQLKAQWGLTPAPLKQKALDLLNA